MLNEGYRRGAKVPRCVGDGHELVDFSVFGAKAFAGLGKLPRTIATRAITIRMQKRTKDEPVKDFSIEHTPPTLAPLRDRLAAWVAVVGDELRGAKPERPASLSDRQADIWRPLLALADAAGDPWPKWAREAAAALHGHDPAADPSVGVLLLRHVREVLDAAGSPALHTAVLLRSLVDRDDGPWAEWWGTDVAAGHTKGPGNRLASILKPYGVAPDQVWAHGGNGRGYKREWFEDAWKRHLPNVTNEAARPNVSEDVRTLEPRSEAISDAELVEPPSPETGSDQQPNVLTFPTTLGTDPNVSGDDEADLVWEAATALIPRLYEDAKRNYEADPVHARTPEYEVAREFGPMVFSMIDQRDPYELLAEVTAHLVKAGAEERRAFDELLGEYRLAEYRAVEALRQENASDTAS